MEIEQKNMEKEEISPIEELKNKKSELKEKRIDLTSKASLDPGNKELLREFSEVESQLKEIKNEIKKEELKEKNKKFEKEKKELLEKKEELTNKLYLCPKGKEGHEELQEEYAGITEQLKEIDEKLEGKKEEEELSEEEAEKEKQEVSGEEKDKEQETLEGTFKRVKEEKEEEEGLIKEKILEKMRTGKTELTKEEKEIYERWTGKKKLEQEEPKKEGEEEEKDKEEKEEKTGLEEYEELKEEEFEEVPKEGEKKETVEKEKKEGEEEIEGKKKETLTEEKDKDWEDRMNKTLEEYAEKDVEVNRFRNLLPIRKKKREHVGEVEKELDEISKKMKDLVFEKYPHLKGKEGTPEYNEIRAGLQARAEAKMNEIKKENLSESKRKAFEFMKKHKKEIALLGISAMLTGGGSIILATGGAGLYGTIGIMGKYTADLITAGAVGGGVASSLSSIRNLLRIRNEERKKETEEIGEKLEEAVETGDEKKLEEVEKDIAKEIKETEAELEKEGEKKVEKGTASLEDELAGKVEEKEEGRETKEAEEAEEKIKDKIEEYKKGEIGAGDFIIQAIPQLRELLAGMTEEEKEKKLKEIKGIIGKENIKKIKEEVEENQADLIKAIKEGKISPEEIVLLEKLSEIDVEKREEESEEKEGKEEVDISKIKKNIGMTVKELQQGLGKSLELNKLELDDEDIENWKKLEEGLEKIRKAYTKDTRLRSEKNPEYEERIKTLFNSVKESKKEAEEGLEIGEITEEEIKKNPDKYIIAPEVFERDYIKKEIKDLRSEDFEALKNHILALKTKEGKNTIEFMARIDISSKENKEWDLYEDLAREVEGKKEIKNLLSMTVDKFIEKYIDPKIKEK